MFMVATCAMSCSQHFPVRDGCDANDAPENFGEVTLVEKATAHGGLKNAYPAIIEQCKRAMS